MSVSDHAYVNFQQDYELNYRLRKVDKRQTEGNRNTLKRLGGQLKSHTAKRILQHGEFHNYVVQNLAYLD